MIKKNIRYLMLMAAMLLAGGSAWGDTTYYLLWGENQNPSQLSSQGSASGTSNWTWNFSGSYASGKNYYFAVSSSSTYTGIISGSGAKDSDVVDGSSMLSSHYKQQYNVGGTDYYYYMVSFSSARTSFSVTYSDGKYTFSGAAIIYTVTPIITGGTITPPTAQSVASGSSISFTVTPSSGYTLTSKTYDGGTSGDITEDGNTFTFTPTGSGTFNVVYSLKYTVTPSITGGTISPSTPQSVAPESYVDFTVAPTSGYSYVSSSYSAGTVAKQGDTDVFRVTPTGSGTLSIVYSGQSAPTVRIGTQPVFNADCGLTVGAYVAQTGCNNVTSFDLYYSNNSMFRTDGNYKTAYESEDVSSSSPGINVNTLITLTANQVEQVVNPNEMLYLRVKGYNSRGESKFSDVVPVKYVCSKFVTQNLTKSFKACPGQHQFRWNEMFQSPDPTTWSVKLIEKAGEAVTPADASADFTLENGQMIWNINNKDVSSYKYQFTAKKTDYADGIATLTINYTVPPASTGSFSSLSASPDEDVTPYTPVALSAEGTKGNIDTIEWTSVPASATFSDISTDLSGDDIDATATFRVNKVSSEMDYTVTVTGYNNTNCSSVSESVTIKVIPDEAEKCD